MRVLTIESTKAAYDRLAMLRDPEAMFVPFDPETIAPFGTQFVEGSKLFWLTYRERVIGQLGEYEDGAFRINLRIPASDKADAAIRRMFETVRTHLDLVARTKAEDKRQRQADPNYVSPQVQRQQNQARQAEAARVRAAKAEATRIRNRRIDARGFQSEDPEGAQTLRLSRKTIEALQGEVRSKEDPIRFRIANYEWLGKITLVVDAGPSVAWKFEGTRESDVFTLAPPEDGLVPDVAKIETEMARQLERNARVQSPEAVAAVLAGMSPPEFSVVDFLMQIQDERRNSWDQEQQVATGENWEIGLHYGSLELRVEGIMLCRWRVDTSPERYAAPIGVTNVAKGMSEEMFSAPAVLASLGSLWVKTECVRYEKDPEAFRLLSVEEIEKDLEGQDFGYGF